VGRVKLAANEVLVAHSMDITQLPFNRLVGLQAEPDNSPFLVSLDGGPQHANHLGTLHACVLLTVAEVGSGVFLLRHLGAADGYTPVVRRLEAKFRRPAIGRVVARAAVAPERVAAWKAELASGGRVWATVPVEVVDGNGTVVLTTAVEWYISRNESVASSDQR
jgi:acyl-coenzyme A thioesterase PaaI-like protein